MSSFEKQIGRRLDIDHHYYAWTERFPSGLEQLRCRRRKGLSTGRSKRTHGRRDGKEARAHAGEDERHSLELGEVDPFERLEKRLGRPTKVAWLAQDAVAEVHAQPSRTSSTTRVSDAALAMADSPRTVSCSRASGSESMTWSISSLWPGSSSPCLTSVRKAAGG